MLKDPEMSLILDESRFAVRNLLSYVSPHGRGNTDIFFALPEVKSERWSLKFGQ